MHGPCTHAEYMNGNPDAGQICSRSIYLWKPTFASVSTMTTSPTSTTVIFVPGAWHGPEHCSIVGSKLQQAGYDIDYVHLASVGPKEHYKSSEADIDVIRKHVLQAVENGQKVVMVMHSYGGVPTQDAVAGLEYKTRQAQGQAGGVTHLFFMCSFIIPEGASLIGAFGGKDLPWFDVSEDKLEVKPMTPEHIFYNDMPDDLVKSSVASLRPHSYQCFHSPVKVASWQTIPSTYLYCLQDNAIPMFVQKMMVEETAKGSGMRTETIDASHSPFHSMPDETAAAIQRAAEIAV